MSEVVKSYEVIKNVVEHSVTDRSVITNRRGRVVVPRKYHMTDEQLCKGRLAWQSTISEVSDKLKRQSGSLFFNPYRVNGGYFGGVQALFLLGANEWHCFGDVRTKMQEDMSTRRSPGNKHSSWEKFSLRGAREGASITKDLMGRIVQNFRTLQRLGGVHPYGWKLKQLCSSIDIKRESDSIWYFKLNTNWDNMNSVAPFYDISAYNGGAKSGRKTKVAEEVVVEGFISGTE